LAHSFLLEPGRWLIQGNWLEKGLNPRPFKGGAIVAWKDEKWFNMVIKLVFPEGNPEEISFEYRGHLHGEPRRYTYVLKHSLLGSVEGEGWIGQQSVIQRFWVLGDRQKRTGLETFYRIDDDTYNLSSGIMSGHYLTSAMEAILARKA
jgi:hypothetical protein